MKKSIFLFLSLLLFLAGAFVSCEEVDETTKYDNWKERNDAFTDSIKALVGKNYVATEQQALDMPVNQMFAIKSSRSTDKTPLYIYCKKITANIEGERPLYTQSTSVFYYGSLITGDSFEGNFVGYTAADQIITGEKNPTGLDSPITFTVEGWLWTDVIQYMRSGERWMLYIPWQCAYGASGMNNILGYSTLTFDLQLVEVIE